MTPIRPLDAHFAAAPQLAASDLVEAAAQGFALIVNNRPDGEAPDAPQDAEMRIAAEAAGVAYDAIPVGHDGFSRAQVDAMTAALRDANGPVLAYCRSGTRSTFLWALARASLGDAPEELQIKARATGYDLTPLMPMLRQLAP